MSESTEQKAVIAWFRTQYKQYRLIAIPNAQKLMSLARNMYAMQKTLAREGLTPGVSDLFLCVGNKRYHGLWIEMKSKGKKLTSTQWTWADDMIDAGYSVRLAFSFEDAKEYIEDYLKEA
jgi:hypothetical protein